MPTFSHGRNTVFKITDASSTLQDISDTLKQVSFPITLDTPETTAFGSTVKSFVVGIKDAKFSASGMFDPTTDAILQGIYGLAGGTAFVYGPVGSTTGSPQYTGTAILTNYQVQGSISDMVAVTADWQVTGPITRTTF